MQDLDGSPLVVLSPESTTEQRPSEEKQVGGVPGRENSTKNEARYSYLDRRAKCNPILIGICVWLLIPFLSIVWGIRQRSWLLALAPLAFAVVLPVCLVASGSIQNVGNNLAEYVFQAIGGVAAYGISLELKKHAINKGYGKPKKQTTI